MPPTSTLRIPVPADYRLARDFCSYGYFLLEPNDWNPRTRTFTTTVELRGVAVTLRVRQGAPNRGVDDPFAHAAGPGVPGWTYNPDLPGPGSPGAPLTVKADRALTPEQKSDARAIVRRILRLDEPADRIAAFHALDPRFARSGRGRLMRSASLFEDVLKTVTSCNVTWPSTVNMNRRLCRVLGKKSASGLYAFPTAARLARVHPSTLRARCSVGYRDVRIVELARIFARAERRQASNKPPAVASPAWMVDPTIPDADMFKGLQELPGVGPYAAANILQLLGRYAHLPLDTESIRHGRTVLGFRGGPNQVMKKVRAHFEPFGEHRFRSYWFELWRYYEAKRGHSWTWERETTGKTFTAALLD